MQMYYVFTEGEGKPLIGKEFSNEGTNTMSSVNFIFGEKKFIIIKFDSDYPLRNSKTPWLSYSSQLERIINSLDLPSKVESPEPQDPKEPHLSDFKELAEFAKQEIQNVLDSIS